jgi:hypothetical protein
MVSQHRFDRIVNAEALPAKVDRRNCGTLEPARHVRSHTRLRIQDHLDQARKKSCRLIGPQTRSVGLWDVVIQMMRLRHAILRGVCPVV